MKKSDNPRNTSRRSFVKKSVVASVAASNLTMFSGMVNAVGTSGGIGAAVLYYGAYHAANYCNVNNALIAVLFQGRIFTDYAGRKFQWHRYECQANGGPLCVDASCPDGTVFQCGGGRVKCDIPFYPPLLS